MFCCVVGKPRGKGITCFIPLEDLSGFVDTFVVIFLEVRSAVITGIEISETFQYSEDGLFVLLGGLEWVVCCEGVHEGPGVQSEFLAIEGGIVWSRT